ncbi:MAG TPA: type II secretion system protein [Gaiellaceae bacterium]|nr:type II secretion system protein [Gaiellaceae bacterium]
MSRLRQANGFTMIEMLVVCLILGVVLTGITTVFVSGSHAELNLNNRFQAQQAARLALDAMRIDAHGACAANVLSSGSKLVLASVPTSGDSTTCGAVGSSSSYPKVVWCALTSPTVSTQYALYRSTATDSSCTTSNGKLEADNLSANTVFSTGSPITVEQLQTFTATMTVSLQSGTAGVPYTLAEALTLRNSVYQTTGSSTACSTSDNTVCTRAICPFSGAACYPPVIQ